MNPPKLVVTGASGFVAGSVIQQALPDWEVHAISRGAPLLDQSGLVWHCVDPLDSRALRACLKQIKPKAAIHAAAIAGIDYCKAHPDEACAVNQGMSQDIAQACNDIGSRLIFVSTDNVFDGESGPYSEDSETHPVNHYGQTKLDAENSVSTLAQDYVIARFSLVMGLPVFGHGNSFLSRMIPNLRDGKELGVPEEEIRSPIDVLTVGAALIELAANDYRGILHLSGNEGVNRLQLVRRIADHLELSTAKVFANDPTQIPGRADRPREVDFDNSRAKSLLETQMLDLQESIQRATTDVKPASS